MNRYVAEGILVDVAQAKTVLIVSASAVEMRESFRVLAGAAAGFSSLRVCRSNDAERVKSLHSGGVALFRCHPDAMRGLSPDVCFVEQRADGVVAEALKPMMATGVGLVSA